jgi:hypothetical protein
MTPLAHIIVEDSTRPLKDRRFVDASKKFGMLDGLHFFEVSAVCKMAKELAPKYMEALKVGQSHLAFLPAPRCWIECIDPAGNFKRVAFLIEQQNHNLALVTQIYLAKNGDLLCGKEPVIFLPLSGHNDLGKFVEHSPDVTREKAVTLFMMISSLLAIINSPKKIGRRQHQPHAGLQRKIASARAMPGKYPMHAWTELVLEARPPRDESQREPRETRLTGEKCLHFVRTHLRIRSGELQLINWHYRGNPALGFKQTRYRVAPGQPHA